MAITTTWTSMMKEPLQGGSMLGSIMTSNNYWAIKESVTTTWSSGTTKQLQGGSMTGFIMASNSAWSKVC